MTPRVRLYACIAAANHRTTLTRVLSDCQARPEAYARREVMRRLHDEGFSYSQIARWLNREHATVMYHLGKLPNKHSPGRKRPRSEDSEARPAT